MCHNANFYISENTNYFHNSRGTDGVPLFPTRDAGQKSENSISGVCSGVLQGNSGKVPGKLLENFSRIAKCYKFWDFGHRERQTCREPWVDTAGTLSPPSVRGVFCRSFKGQHD